jgi:DUF1009 family protein
MARRLTIIAGSGALPSIVARAALAAGDAVQVLALGEGLDIPGAEVVSADLGNLQAMMLTLRSFGATHLVLAGGVSLSDRRREELSAFLDPRAGTVSVGDSALSGLAQAIRGATGAELIGPHEVVAGLVAEPGHLAGPILGEALLASGRLAFEAARHVGRIDLGQAAVVAGQRVVAVEDVAGTDELLARIAAYRERGLFGDGQAGLVLAKASKPQQPAFVDLPAIGPRTVAGAVRAGIGLIVVEAGRTLLLDRAALFAAVAATGIGLYGLTVHE